MKKLVCILYFVSLFNNGFCQLSQQQDPIYLRTDTCWKGFFPHKDQYVEYLLSGSSKLQDPYHVLVKPELGLMITYADQTNFESNIPLLEAHRKWEIDYWKKQPISVRVEDCKELYKDFSNILVTELEITSNNLKKTMKNCFIGVSGKEGVYVFSFSSPSNIDHELIKRFLNSIKVVDKPLNSVDIKNEAMKLNNTNN
jgi:hypothetical protein